MGAVAEIELTALQDSGAKQCKLAPGRNGEGVLEN